MKKVLIINKNGFVGLGIHETLSTTYVVGGISESSKGHNTQLLDVSDKYAVNHFLENQSFDIVIHCPKPRPWDSPDQTNEEILETEVTKIKNVVNAIQDRGAKLIYISSKDVYGGDDPPYRIGSERSPVNYHGKACLESEYVVQKNLEDYCIVRPGRVYGFTESGGYDEFTQRVLDVATEEGEEFNDQIIEYPTLIDDITNLVKRIIDHDLTHNYNISSRVGVTNYQWARIICEVHGIDQTKITASQESEQINRPYDAKFNLESITDLGLSVRSVKDGTETARMQNLCTFRPIYIQDLANSFGGQSSSNIRRRLGGVLANQDSQDADIVVPVPESGIYPASGYANASNIPLKFALSKQESRHRTLYDSNIDRKETVKNSIRSIPEMIENKKIILVDEALLSGTTVRSVLPKLSAAEEIHLRLSSPPVMRDCPAGIYPEHTDLFMKRFDQLEDEDLDVIEKRLASEFEISSVRFVPTETYSNIVGKPEGECTYCFH